MLQETLNQNYPERQNTVIFNYLLRKFCIFDFSSIFKLFIKFQNRTLTYHILSENLKYIN